MGSKQLCRLNILCPEERTPTCFPLPLSGAGISGLAAAYRLKQHGLQVQLFEATSRTGGVIRSDNTNGYLAEWGPHSLQDNSPLIAQLIRELGLECATVDAIRTSTHVISGVTASC